jgi:hypothetical protein
MFNFFNKWKKVEATDIAMPRPKESVKTKIHSKRIDREVQVRHSRKLQRIINKGQHHAWPTHCLTRLRKAKRSWSSSKI